MTAQSVGPADAALVEAIRQVLVDSPFTVRAAGLGAAAHAGLRTSRERVRRLMRENRCRRRPHGQPRGRAHDGRSSETTTRCGEPT